MDRKWRALAMLIVLIAAVCGIYFLIASAPAGLDYGSLVSIMDRYGIDSGSFSGSVQGINALSDEELAEIERDFGEFSEQTSEAWLSELAGIYSGAVKMEKSRRELEAVVKEAKESDDPACNKIALFKEMSDKGGEIAILSEALFDNTSVFLERHPERAGELDLAVYPNAEHVSRVREAHEAQGEIYSALEAACQ